MKKHKKNIIWLVFWTIINVLFSMLNQYIETLSFNTDFLGRFSPLLNWLGSIGIWVAGPILGLQGAVVFFLIDSFFFRQKIKNKYILFVVRIILVILIILLVSYIERKYF